MAGLKEGLEMMLQNIDVYCDLLLTERRSEAAQFTNQMGENFSALIGPMVSLYDQPGFPGVKEDKQYWISQTGRIEEALNSEDVFFVNDVLRNETAENFKLFMKMLG